MEYVKFIQLLLNNGADINIPDNDGNTFSQYMDPIKNPKIFKIINEHSKNLSKVQRKEAREAGNYHMCAVCKKSTNVKRCTGCFLQWYCGKECLKSDWKKHKNVCKETQAKYKLVDLQKKPGEIREYGVHFVWKKGSSQTCHMCPRPSQSQEVKTAKSHFIVKIQMPMPLGNPLSKVLFQDHFSSDLSISNEDKSLDGCISAQDPIIPELLKIIKEHGVCGSKGYFYAIKEEKSLKINTIDIQPPEYW